MNCIQDFTLKGRLKCKETKKDHLGLVDHFRGGRISRSIIYRDESIGDAERSITVAAERLVLAFNKVLILANLMKRAVVGLRRSAYLQNVP